VPWRKWQGFSATFFRIGFAALSAAADPQKPAAKAGAAVIAGASQRRPAVVAGTLRDHKNVAAEGRGGLAATASAASSSRARHVHFRPPFRQGRRTATSRWS